MLSKYLKQVAFSTREKRDLFLIRTQRIRIAVYRSTPWLALAGSIALLYGALSFSLLRPKWFESNMALVDGIAKVLSAASIVVGGYLAYFKFFRGRLTCHKLRLEMTIGSCPIGNSGTLYWVDVMLENKGSTALFLVDAEVDAQLIPGMDIWMPTTKLSHREQMKRDTVIEIAEVHNDHFHFMLPQHASVRAVVFRLIVRCGSDTWTRWTTVPVEGPPYT